MEQVPYLISGTAWHNICSLRNGDQCRVNEADDIDTEIRVCGKKLDTVSSFKYLGSVDSDEGSRPAILTRIAKTTAAMTKRRPIWNGRNITLRDQTDAANNNFNVFISL